MTRTVFDNAMTAHVWAQQNQPRGQSHNGNFWFEGRAIYSYGRHYCAGYALPDCEGGIVFLTNADSSSVTTNGKHMPAVHRAIGYKGYAVPGLDQFAQILDYQTRGADTKAARRARAFPAFREELARHWPGEEAAAAILAAMGDRDPAKAAATLARKVKAKEEAAAAKRERDRRDTLARGAKHTAAIPLADFRRRIARELGAYASHERGRDVLASKGRTLLHEYREAKARGWTRIAADVKARRDMIRAAVREAEARHESAYRNRTKRAAIQRYRESVSLWLRDLAGGPDAAAGMRSTDSQSGRLTLLGRRAGEVAAAAAGLSRHVPLSESTLARLRDIHAEASAKSEELGKAGAELKAAELAQEIQAWRNGEGPARFRFDSPHGGAAVRAVAVERDDSGAIVAGTLQTSHGADVPLTHAIRAFRFLKHCHDTGTAWRANGRTLRVGHFRVDSVAASGDFVAGCHRIAWQEVESLARGLGVFDMAAADTTEERAAVTA